jgi:hypothetical protein
MLHELKPYLSLLNSRAPRNRGLQDRRLSPRADLRLGLRQISKYLVSINHPQLILKYSSHIKFLPVCSLSCAPPPRLFVIYTLIHPYLYIYSELFVFTYEWLIVEIFFVLQSHKSHEHVLGAENPDIG